ncbi:ATP-dependent zinc metalloprotease FtsH [Salinispira pacifica]|nr:ATP-dependent zinc metalloprotease FtsH [Salinispira pacifica]
MNFNFKNNRFALLMLIAVLVSFIFFFLPGVSPQGNEIDYSQFLNYLESGVIQQVNIIGNTVIEGRMQRNGEVQTFTTRIPYVDEALITRLEEEGVAFGGEKSPTSPMMVLVNLFPWVIGIFFIWFMLRQLQGNGNKAFSFGKSKAKMYADDGKKVIFSDVAGQKEAKYELQEVVEFLKNPKKFEDMGAKIPKGVLLVGMPGTGKTLLAKATAGEAGVKFFHMSGSDFVEMFVGVGASRVRDLFEQGRKNAPCIIFIDELDAVGRTRGAGYGGGHDEREQTLNQMLVEMDGFDTSEGVIILAATNRADVLDPALLRPGRFDRRVVVDMPDMNERLAILKIHASKIPLDPDVQLEVIARATPGASGADIANLVNEAALQAARHNHKYVRRDDFEEARDKVFMGVARKSKTFSMEENRWKAYHEAGHALLHYYLENADPLHKVDIIPRGSAGGITWSLPEKETYIQKKGWLEDRISISYGGMIAEKLEYNETSTGVSNDLKQATDIARHMVCNWGMSSLGPIALGQDEQPIFLGKEIARHNDYSDSLAEKIDQEMRKILDAAYSRAEKILSDHKDKLDSLAEELVRKETLSDEEVRKLLGFPPAQTGDDHDSIASEAREKEQQKREERHASKETPRDDQRENAQNKDVHSNDVQKNDERPSEGEDASGTEGNS